MMSDRHSRAEQGWVIKDPEKRAQKEAENSIRQADRVLELIETWSTKGECPFDFTVLTDLNRIATIGVNKLAGVFRPASIAITGSRHKPPEADSIPKLITEMCDYVCKHWKSPGKALHLSAYVMWRINWIHPFEDGNGRTARAAAYLVLCANIGTRLPGINTIPEQISENKDPYYKALEEADNAYKRGIIDVRALEDLLENLLVIQLGHIYTQAGGNRLCKDIKIPEEIEKDATGKDRRSTGWRDNKIIRWIEGHPATSLILGTIIAAIIGGLMTKISGIW